jgi:hypothetical protein
MFLGVLILSISTILNSCNSNTSTAYVLTGDTIADGKAMVQLHCTKCHSLVPANALTKEVWTVHTLPTMAKYFSIATYGIEYFKRTNDTSGLSFPEWNAIVSYYKKLAPDTLAIAKAPVPLINDWAGFTLKKAPRANDITFTTAIAANPTTGNIYTSDLVRSNLTEWTTQLRADKSINLPSPVVNFNFTRDTAGLQQAVLSCIGRIDPVDFPNGKVFSLDLNGMPNLTQLASELPRVVQTLSADFDKDGKNEVVVCGQGNIYGGVYLLKRSADGKTYNKTSITERPGAAQATFADYNNDGWLDLMVLYGSNDEGLALYLNDKKGGFTTHELLKFPPVYGSTSFQMADLDHDGDLDLIYTCGYNYRDSRILKPYHGVYIYTNTGNFSFKQSWFYPVNGCTKAIAADFDDDGDLDIATIAFFADMKSKPAEEFIYFEQDKPLSFKPHAVPVSKLGRWMAMDVADYNHDGKPDILLANYASGFMFQQNFMPNWDEHTPFIVLENHMIKKP